MYIFLKSQSFFSDMLLFNKVAKELGYEDTEVVAAGHIYERTVSVYDDPYPDATGRLDKLSKEQ